MATATATHSPLKACSPLLYSSDHLTIGEDAVLLQWEVLAEVTAAMITSRVEDVRHHQASGTSVLSGHVSSTLS